MGRFLAGFLFASVIWGGLFYGYATGVIQLNLGDDEIVDAGVPDEAPAEDEGRKKRKKGWKKRANKKKRYGSGNSLVGDRLDGPGVRELDAEHGGGEEQLVGHEIEAGFDSVFPKIRRCLILAADDAPTTGKLVFGMQISGSGRVKKVNLKGPSGITKSEAGSCLRNAAKGIKFRSFDGPDMVVHYPLTLE